MVVAGFREVAVVLVGGGGFGAFGEVLVAGGFGYEGVAGIEYFEFFGHEAGVHTGDAVLDVFAFGHARRMKKGPIVSLSRGAGDFSEQKGLREHINGPRQ